jgi:voltage-gated potassium channel
VKKLKNFIFHPTTEIIIGILIIVSVVLTILEVKAPQGSQIQHTYFILGLVITALFIIELLIRWRVSRDTRQFFSRYWIDIIAVLPPIRALRVLRVLRLLRVVRLGILITRRTQRSTSMIQQGLMEHIVLIIVLMGVFFIGAVGMFMVEKGNSSFNSLEKSTWWSLFTLMAGEPIGGEATSFFGKIISAVVMLGGFTFFAVFTGVVSAVMVKRFSGRIEATEMELNELKDHHIICGWNRSGIIVVKELQACSTKKTIPIVIISEFEIADEFKENNIDMGNLHFVTADYTSTEVLKKIRVEKAAAAILLADKSRPRTDQDRDARTILAALTIERLSPGIFTCAELLRRENQSHLAMAGVEDIIIGDEYTGNLIAHSSRTRGLVTVMDELLTATRGNQFYKIPAFKKVVGKCVTDAISIIKKKHDGILVSIEQSGKQSKTITNPPGDYIIMKDDYLIIIAGKEPK